MIIQAIFEEHGIKTKTPAKSRYNFYIANIEVLAI